MAKVGMTALDILRDAAAETIYWPRTYRSLIKIEKIHIDGLVGGNLVGPLPEYKGLQPLPAAPREGE